jgi:outer membrane cobalamin receptor
VRGNWGHEGKVLLLIDGQRANELLYSTTQFGGHYPADLIERVEIIRGPGSAVYGGFAELAVINVITRTPESLNGVNATARAGMMERTFGTQSFSAAFAQQIPKARGLTIDAKAHIGQTKRSDFEFVDIEGGRYQMGDDNILRTAMVNFGVDFRRARFRLIYDDHEIGYRGETGLAAARSDRARFSSLLLDAQYEGRLPYNITLTPRISYSYQTPWQVTDKESASFYNKSADRLTGGLFFTYGGSKVQLLAGIQGYFERGHVNDPTLVGYQTLLLDKINLYIGNFAGYAQLIWPNKIVNVTVGARAEWNSLFGASFVPRVALTRAFKRFNVKLLYSQAFRAPGIENININPMILPERTNVLEAELGRDAPRRDGRAGDRGRAAGVPRQRISCLL